jgi:hypothetical protein
MAWARGLGPAEHAANEATDSLTVARIGEGYRCLRFDWNGHVNGLGHLGLRETSIPTLLKACTRRVLLNRDSAWAISDRNEGTI